MRPSTEAIARRPDAWDAKAVIEASKVRSAFGFKVARSTDQVTAIRNEDTAELANHILRRGEASQGRRLIQCVVGFSGPSIGGTVVELKPVPLIRSSRRAMALIMIFAPVEVTIIKSGVSGVQFVAADAVVVDSQEIQITLVLPNRGNARMFGALCIPKGCRAHCRRGRTLRRRLGSYALGEGPKAAFYVRPAIIDLHIFSRTGFL